MNAIHVIWYVVSGAKPAKPGPAGGTGTPAVPANKLRATLTILALIALPVLGIIMIQNKSGESTSQPIAQAPMSPPPGKVTQSTNSPVAKAEVPPTPTVHITEGDVFTAGNGNTQIRNVIINPNAIEVKSTSREKLKLSPNSSVEVKVPLGATANWETQRTVLNEWQDSDQVWHTHNRGEAHPKVLKALRFTSGTEPEEVDVLFTGL
ncbi:hypothetical protein EPO17_02530 [Patescibacteria group bacterium]|nr:MAG: hypothetical protein EPO17_02530 [Patescibacteria group bacterium]